MITLERYVDSPNFSLRNYHVILPLTLSLSFYLQQSDPYVKFELEQNNAIFDKDMGDKKSSKKKDEANPVYDEVFVWNIPTLENMELTCKVMDDGKIKVI